MAKIFNIILILLAWAFSLINTSGWGVAHDSMYWTGFTIIVIALYIRQHDNTNLFVGSNRRIFYLTIFAFIFIPFLLSGEWEGFTYFTMLPFVYAFSRMRVTERDIRVSANIIALLGIMVLAIYSRTETLSGWNDNQIAMVGLFSYIYYTMTLYGKPGFRKIIIGLAVTVVYMNLIFSATDSRSTAIFIILAFIFAYRSDISGKICSYKYFIPIAVSLPLIIAVFAVCMPENSVFNYFSDWSMQKYGKTGFNGRNEIWQYTFEHLPQTYFLGDGKFLINHHNSTMACLGVFGVLGYYCWYKLFRVSTGFIARYSDDKLALGCLMSFFLIFWQQSFDLGFICITPNMIPYTILGLGIARVYQLQDSGQYGQN